MQTTPGLKFKYAPSSDGSTIEGYLARIGERDLGGDIIDPGSFDKTLAEIKSSGHRLPMLLGHRPDSPIGSWRQLTPDASGLYAVGEIDPDVAKGKEALSLITKGHISGLSIGYVPNNGVQRDDGYHLKEIKLVEGSVVAAPMASRARITIRDFSDLTDYAAFLREGGLVRRDAELIARRSWDAIAAGGEEIETDKVLAHIKSLGADWSTKFNPNHDDRGRFSEGSGGGGSSGGGYWYEGADAPQPFTPQWSSRWAAVSAALGALALHLIQRLGSALAEIYTRKGAMYIHNAINKAVSKKQVNNIGLDSLIEQIMQMPQATRGKVANELLAGLSEDDANAIAASINQ